MPESEIPQRGDIWVMRSGPAVKVIVVGRSEDQVVVEPVEESTFIQGRKAYPLAAFVRSFRLMIRFKNRED